MKYRLIVVANLGLIIGIILGLYFSKSIILFLSIFVAIILWISRKRLSKLLQNTIERRPLRRI